MMAEATEHMPKTSWRSLLTRWIGYLLAGGGLVWVFHDLHVGHVLSQAGRVNWVWLFPAIMIDTLAFAGQGLRWSILLRPIGRLSPLRAMQAVYIGLFINEVLPLRAGEPSRLIVVSQWLARPIGQILPSMVVERLFDGVWLMLAVGLTAILVKLPPSLSGPVDVFGVIVIILVLIFAGIVLLSRKRGRNSTEPTQRTGLVASFVRNLAQGIRTIGLGPGLGLAFLVSSSVIIFQVVAFWFVVMAYGIDLSLWKTAAVLIIIQFGTMIPNAPSNVGSYQFFCVLAMTMFGIDKTVAAGFSIGVFVILTIPLWAVGLVSIWKSEFSFGRLRREIAVLFDSSRGSRTAAASEEKG